MHKVQVTPVIGLPQFDGWAQTAQSHDGRLVVALSVFGSQARNVGRDLADIISQSSPRAAAQVYALLESILAEASKKNCNIQFVAGLFDEHQTVYAAYNGSILLKRSEKIGYLLQAKPSIQLLTGKYLAEDILVFTTVPGELFAGEIKQKLSQGYDPDTIVTSIIPGVHGLSNSATTVIVFITARSSEPEPHDPHFNIALAVEDDQSEESLSSEEHVSSSELQAESQVLSPEPAPIRKAVISNQMSERMVKLGSVLGKLVHQIVSKTKNFVRSSSHLFSHQPYVQHYAQKKYLQKVGIGLLVFLSVGVVIGRWWYVRQKTISAAENTVKPLIEQLQQLPAQAESDPVAARDQAQALVEQLKLYQGTLPARSPARSYVDDQVTSAEQVLQQVSGKVEVSELPIFFDLRLAEPGFVTSQVATIGETAIFIDSGMKKSIVLNLTTKQVSSVSLDQVPTVNDVVMTAADAGFLLAEGIWRFRPNEETKLDQVIEPDEYSRTARFLAWFNESVYLYSPEKKNIYRYTAKDGRFEKPTFWLRSTQSADLANVTSFAIDGSVWMATREGRIFSFVSGREALFEVKGLAEPFTEPILLRTSENLPNLYVLEPSKQRLVVLGKDGQFLKEVRSSSLETVTTFFVPEENKVMAVSGSVVFEIAL